MSYTDLYELDDDDRYDSVDVKFRKRSNRERSREVREEYIQKGMRKIRRLRGDDLE